MNWQRIWAMIRKDVIEFSKSKYVMSAIIGIPLLFAILFPFISLLPIANIDSSEFETGEYGQFIDNLFSKAIDNWDDLGAQAQTLVMIAYSMFIMVLMLPIIIPAVTASETVVGEKERKTMEAVLASPMSESEIVMGKIISSFLPSIFGTIVAAIGYIVITDIIIYPHIGQLLFPDLISMVLVFIFSPMVSIISVELMIMISTRVTSVRDAYQLGSLIVLPLIMLVVAEMFGLLFQSTITMIAGIAILAVLIFVLFKITSNIFDRERALVKMV